MIDFRALACALVLALTPVSAAGTTGTDTLFDTGQIADVETGSTLIYSHLRSAVEEIEVTSIEDGKVAVAIRPDGEKRRTVVTLTNGKYRRSLEHLPGDRGNPVFIVFMESALSAVAKASGGSPFYLRNRFKDALATGGEVSEITITHNGTEVPAQRIEYHPFVNDPNRNRLGKALADMVLAFTLSDEVPGKFVELTARANAEGETAFIETVRFVEMEN